MNRRNNLYKSFNSPTWWKERDIGFNVIISCYSLLCPIKGLRHRNAISIMKEKTVNCINMQTVFNKITTVLTDL